MTAELAWFRQQVELHLRLFFKADARSTLSAPRFSFATLDEAKRARGDVLVVPIDVPHVREPRDAYEVSFNGTRLTLWGRLERPSSDWRAVPNEAAPLFFRHTSGALMPAWNWYANALDALTLREELASTKRDKHGRFPASESARAQAKLLQVPIFNEGLAAFVAALTGPANAELQTSLEGLLEPPAIVLSHDCDILRGNDAWTQAIRFYRLLRGGSGAAPRPSNLLWVAYNTLRPRDFYFDNVLQMIDLERALGFRSVFYVLNGKGGRFGARSGSRPARELVASIPSDFEIGVHYNYDTHLEPERLRAQIDEITSMGAEVRAGRAHYLRFDPARSFALYRERGILCDETLGFPDVLGYRAGIAGVYRPFDASTGRAVDLLEVPLACMDSPLVATGDPVGAFASLFDHVARVGGAVSLLFHPGLFYNPEEPDYLGVYRAQLEVARRAGARSLLPRELVAAAIA